MSVVLVHGAWADGSSWGEIVRLLHDQGHEVSAVQLPMTSLQEDVEATRRAIDAASAPIVLVGHSYGGLVISAAAVDAPAVAALVYVAAYAPLETESVMSLSHEGATMTGADAIHYGQDGWTRIDPDRYGQVLGHDLPHPTQRLLATVQGMTHVSCFTATAGPVAWRTLPCHYVLSRSDRILDPELQRMFAARTGSRLTEVVGSHLAILSQPQVVGAAIEKAISASLANHAVDGEP